MPESSIELLPTISEPLRMEIHYDMHMQIMITHTFFKLSNDINSWMMRRVCHDAIDSLMLSRGDTLFCQGEISEHPRMYFIKSGLMLYSHQTGKREDAKDGNWASEGGLWTFWTHCGGMQATTDCRLLSLDVSRFQSLTRQFSKQREFGKRYGQLYVNHLNSCASVDLTDLEDPEMDVEWLAMQSCPGAGLSNSSGLLGKIAARSSLGARSSLPTSKRQKASMLKQSTAGSQGRLSGGWQTARPQKKTWRNHISAKISFVPGAKIRFAPSTKVSSFRPTAQHQSNQIDANERTREFRPTAIHEE